MDRKFILTGLVDYQVDGKDMVVWAESVSDGYHTMEELYEHRIALFAALINIVSGIESGVERREIPGEWLIGMAWKSRLHSDGTMFEGGYFIAGINFGEEQISYHMKEKWWDKFECQELERAPKYDGHTSKDVIERLFKI